MTFNSRRVSTDRVVYEKILQMCDGKLYIAPYSEKLFSNQSMLCVSEAFLDLAGVDDWCFLENQDPASRLRFANEIVLFCWNRTYPADLKFPLELLEKDWECVCRDEFSGNSHEKVTMEVYRRCGKSS